MQATCIGYAGGVHSFTEAQLWLTNTRRQYCPLACPVGGLCGGGCAEPRELLVGILCCLPTVPLVSAFGTMAALLKLASDNFLAILYALAAPSQFKVIPTYFNLISDVNMISPCISSFIFRPLSSTSSLQINLSHWPPGSRHTVIHPETRE